MEHIQPSRSARLSSATQWHLVTALVVARCLCAARERPPIRTLAQTRTFEVVPGDRVFVLAQG